ncbi:MAG: hypothetical protein M3R65_05865 [Gemmatimonadota bacterium]|nr:hypothetical protein [Gemmatimonadota bacterium]
MAQIDRTFQATSTTLSAADVLSEAKRFFSRRNSIYTAFLDMEGPTFISLRGMGGEEVVIGVSEQDGVTLVSGSTYMFDQQVARFLSLLPVAGQPDFSTVPVALPAAAATRT